MRNMVRTAIFLPVALFLFAGCGGAVRSASLYQEVNKNRISTAYVVTHPIAIPNADLYLHKIAAMLSLVTPIVGAGSAHGEYTEYYFQTMLSASEYGHSYHNVQKEYKIFIPLYIQAALSEYDISTSIVPEKPGTSDLDLYVEYLDVWHLDRYIYLHTLEIVFRDARTGALLAAGKYETTGIHTYPDPEEITREVVDSVMEKMGFSRTMR